MKKTRVAYVHIKSGCRVEMDVDGLLGTVPEHNFNLGMQIEWDNGEQNYYGYAELANLVVVYPDEL